MTDFRALCTELLNQLHGYASANPHHAVQSAAAFALAIITEREEGRDG